VGRSPRTVQRQRFTRKTGRRTDLGFRTRNHWHLTFTTNAAASIGSGTRTTAGCPCDARADRHAGAAWNHTELVRTAEIAGLNGQPINWPQSCREPLTNPAGVKGDPLAGAPRFQANARARHRVHAGDYERSCSWPDCTPGTSSRARQADQGSGRAIRSPTIIPATDLRRGGWSVQDA